MGFPLERYDSVGRWRDQYADGKPVEDSAVAEDRSEISGVDGLLAYLRGREKQIVRTLASKMLGYALGRTILASDQPLIDRMAEAGGEAEISRMVAAVVSSRQFRNRAAREPETQVAALRGGSR
jgi:hypothetical protein